VAQAAPASQRVQGIASTASDLVLRSGKSLTLELGVAITEAKLTRTIFGASSIELEIFDPERRLLRNLLLAQKWDAEIDGLHFRWPGGLSKSGDTLTLTLEDRWIALLREKEGPKRVIRGQGPHRVTRAEFIKMLVEEACGPNLRFFCPQLHRKQPIKNKTQGKKAGQEAKENREKGIGLVKHLKAFGKPATPQQKEIGERALRTADSTTGITPRVEEALMCALLDESGLGSLTGGKNVLQAEGSGEGAAIGDVEAEVHNFLTGSGGYGQGAIEVAKKNPTYSPAEIATTVQRNAAFLSGGLTEGAKPYARFLGEAKEWVEAFGGEATEDIEVVKDYEFEVKKNEDYWTAIKELAKEVNWRAFVVANTFYYMPEPELLRGMVRLAIDGETLAGASGVENVDFEYDGNNPVTEIDIEAFVELWKPPPGSVLTLADHGPASVGFGSAAPSKDKKGNLVGISDNRNAQTGEGRGRYIVSTIEVPLDDDQKVSDRIATIKAHRATPPLPEAPNPRETINNVQPGTGGNKTVERMLEAMEKAAAKDKPYVWGGFDPNTGFDCSGAVSYALKVGGFLTERTTTQGLASFGQAGAGQWITVYDHANTGDPHTEHCAIEIAGIVFESGGGSENGNPNGGLGKVTSGVQEFLKQFEIKRHPKGY
jgi:hypothetical protein